jgi:hypothetical protein
MKKSWVALLVAANFLVFGIFTWIFVVNFNRDRDTGYYFFMFIDVVGALDCLSNGINTIRKRSVRSGVTGLLFGAGILLFLLLTII